MKKALFASVAALPLFMAACSDDGGGTTGVNNGDIVMNGTLSVDEEMQRLTMVLEGLTMEMCVLDDKTINWRNVSSGPIYYSYAYQFHGDTLLLTDCTEGCIKDAELYVGGKSGDVYGDWNYTGCLYDTKSDETVCDEALGSYLAGAYHFSPGKVSVNARVDTDGFTEHVEKTANYMDSYFMYMLYLNLSGISVEPDLSGLFMDAQSYVQDFREEMITVSEQTDMSQTFTMGGEPYTVKLNKVELLDNIEASVQGTTADIQGGYDVSVTVTHGEITCELTEMKKEVDKSLCKEENREFLDIDYDLLEDDYYDDYDDYGEYYGMEGEEDYVEISYYTKSNMDEFVDCLRDIASSPYGAMYKKMARQNVDAKKRIRKVYERMQKLSGR